MSGSVAVGELSLKKDSNTADARAMATPDTRRCAGVGVDGTDSGSSSSPARSKLTKGCYKITARTDNLADAIVSEGRRTAAWLVRALVAPANALVAFAAPAVWLGGIKLLALCDGGEGVLPNRWRGHGSEKFWCVRCAPWAVIYYEP